MNDDAIGSVQIQMDDPFARVRKAMLDDATLSWKAKGMLAYLLGKQSGWKVRLTDLTNKSTTGRDSIRAGLEELKKAGYIKITDSRKLGQFSYVWHISDKPVFIDDAPCTGFPYTVKPVPDKPSTENPTLSKKTQNKNGSTKNREPDADPILEFPNLNTPDFRRVWGYWKQDRKDRKNPLTDYAERLGLMKCSAWGPEKAIIAINIAIERAWKGLYEPKEEYVQNSNQNGSTGGSHRQERSSNPAADERRRFIRSDTSEAELLASLKNNGLI